MLYIYTGEDIDTARKKVQATVTSMLSKNTNALYFRVTPDDFHSYSLSELIESQGLFKNEYIVVLDSVCELVEARDEVAQRAKEMAEAPHVFFILDRKLLAPVKKKLEKYAHTSTDFPLGDKKNTESSFNTFALTDALGERNTKRLWMLFREAKRSGVRDEEIHGVLFWMLKSMSLALHTKTPEEANMKPYPYSKAQRFAKNYTNEEVLNALVSTFAFLPTNSRRNGIPLEYELERFILTL